MCKRTEKVGYMLAEVPPKLQYERVLAAQVHRTKLEYSRWYRGHLGLHSLLFTRLPISITAPFAPFQIWPVS